MTTREQIAYAIKVGEQRLQGKGCTWEDQFWLQSAAPSLARKLELALDLLQSYATRGITTADIVLIEIERIE